MPTQLALLPLQDLLIYSHIAHRVNQNPRLLAAKDALCANSDWDDALLAVQIQALCEVPLQQASSAQLATALRRLRSAAIAALAQLDLCLGANIERVTGNMAMLADVCLQQIISAVGRELALRFGMPVDEAGQGIDVQVVAMGKHGGRELNVSSDIDIVLLARTLQGDTAGVAVHGALRRCSNSEFLNQWARTVVQLLNNPTNDGFVFRVDTLLRPHGSEGPLVVEHAMFEDYLVTQGRMWERLAWLKARGVHTPVFETAVQHSAGHASWQAIVLPFVYRRYLDYTVVDALRDLHSRIRAERRSFEAKAYNGLHVKLARGGIREVEFWVQGQQLIRGGRDTRLRDKATLPALAALAAAGVIDTTLAQLMAVHYRLLRRTEHAVQYINDSQTHVLPAADAARASVALAMGYANVQALDDALASGMNEVAITFDALFAGVVPQSSQPTQPQPIPEQLDVPSYAKAASDKAHSLPVNDATRTAVNALLSACAVSENMTQPVFERLAGFIFAISKRKTYLDLLLQHPPALSRVQSLMTASAFAAQYLHHHPALLDTLIDGKALYAVMDANYWQAEQTCLLAQLQSLGTDEEAQLNELRHTHHAWVLRILAQDLEGLIDVRTVSDALSQAADNILAAALHCVHFKQCGSFSVPAGLGIIAYGKLGGKELGYGSDLDIVFVYEPALALGADSHYPRLVQRLISWLSVNTSAGRLFEIDTALRPNGQAGLMLTTMTAFSQYQLGHDAGTHAWLWEHQALSRARLCAGDMGLAASFKALRSQVLCLPREQEILKNEIREMRQKVTQGHPVPEDIFDAKHSAGGMVDIEFAVQYLVLRYAAEHQSLQANVGNVALLHAAAQAGLISSDIAQQVGRGYMALRTAQHHCRLQDEPHVWFKRGSPQAQALQDFTPAIAALCAAFASAS
jgi:[glutamine synthetase] adenylyltransferase / [glutamine synthetase]-adenylyl-L-tyrosine phosphorylase